jgi:hypothetical protein
MNSQRYLLLLLLAALLRSPFISPPITKVIDTIVENTSDHHPIRMVFKFEHKAYKNESKKCSEDREKNKMGKGG